MKTNSNKIQTVYSTKHEGSAVMIGPADAFGKEVMGQFKVAPDHVLIATNDVKDPQAQVAVGITGIDVYNLQKRVAAYERIGAEITSPIGKNSSVSIGPGSDQDSFYVTTAQGNKGQKSIGVPLSFGDTSELSKKITSYAKKM